MFFFTTHKGTSLDAMTAMVRASGLQGYQSLVRGLGADPLKLLQRQRIAPESLNDDEALIPVRSVVNLLEASAAATQCPDFGLRLAQKQDISLLGPLAIAMLFRHESVVGEVIEGISDPHICRRIRRILCNGLLEHLQRSTVARLVALLREMACLQVKQVNLVIDTPRSANGHGPQGLADGPGDRPRYLILQP